MHIPDDYVAKDTKEQGLDVVHVDEYYGVDDVHLEGCDGYVVVDIDTDRVVDHYNEDDVMSMIATQQEDRQKKIGRLPQLY